MDKNDRTTEFKDNYYTHNRKLKLEEYNDNGDLIDVIEFSQRELWEFYMFKCSSYNDMEIAIKKDREYFKGKKLELARRMRYLFNSHFFDENLIKDMEHIFEEYTIEQIEFALNFKEYSINEVTREFYITPKDFNHLRTMKFLDILNWTKNSSGIYYAVSNDGVKGMLFLEKPTKKQAQYQRQENGKRIVFLSFKDWKEYSVNESEL